MDMFQYVINKKGKRESAIVPIKEFERFEKLEKELQKNIEDLEDMEDLLVIMQRKDEPKYPFSEALERIKKYREKNGIK